MVDRHKRVKKKKYVRTPGGKTVKHYVNDKKSAAECMVTGEVLSGTGNQNRHKIRKKAATKRRPSVKFGGVLSSTARRQLWDNYALVTSRKKDFNEVPTKLKGLLKTQIREGK